MSPGVSTWRRACTRTYFEMVSMFVLLILMSECLKKKTGLHRLTMNKGHHLESWEVRLEDTCGTRRDLLWGPWGLEEGQVPRLPLLQQPQQKAGGAPGSAHLQARNTPSPCPGPHLPFQHALTSVLQHPGCQGRRSAHLELHLWARRRPIMTTTSGVVSPHLRDLDASARQPRWGTRPAWGRAGSHRAAPPDAGAWHTEKQTNLLGSAEKLAVHPRTLYQVYFSAFSWQGNLGFPFAHHAKLLVLAPGLGSSSCQCFRLSLAQPLPSASSP